jgi:hypothetical protein
MANPNIVNVTTINGNTAYLTPNATSANVAWQYNGTTSITGLTPASGQVIKIDNIVATNVTSAAANVSVAIADNPTYASGVAHYIAYQISVPPNAALTITDKTTAFYVTENQSIGVTVGTASAIHFVASFEAIS